MTIEKRETVSLIGSDKVQGTAVYGADGAKVGSIERVMIEKITGRVSYAVLSFGGFLGFGDDFYPLPWPSLKYNVDLGGYQTMVPIDKIKAAPKYARNSSWNWDSGNGALEIIMASFRLEQAKADGVTPAGFFSGTK
jgi:sporulation protein YlmC with PRC-barrel domain